MSARLSRRVGAEFHGSGGLVLCAGMGRRWSAGGQEGGEPVLPAGGDELGGGGEQLNPCPHPRPLASRPGPSFFPPSTMWWAVRMAKPG